MDDNPQQETIMVNSIGGASAAQAAYAPIPKKDDEAALGPASTVTSPDAEATPPAPSQSAESAAARLGDELNAQADAARVQRAVDASPASATASSEDSDAAEETGSAQDPAAAAPAPAGGAGGAGGAAASSETTDTDYIAEADTNSDKTVSDEERAAYEAKLREQNEKQAEVRAAYGQDVGATPALDVTA